MCHASATANRCGAAFHKLYRSSRCIKTFLLGEGNIPTSESDTTAALPLYFCLLIGTYVHDSLEIPAHTCTHVRSITVSNERTGRGASAVRGGQERGPLRGSGQPRSRVQRRRRRGRGSLPGWLPRMCPRPPAPLPFQSSASRGGSVRAWYMVVRTDGRTRRHNCC